MNANLFGSIVCVALLASACGKQPVATPPQAGVPVTGTPSPTTATVAPAADVVDAPRADVTVAADAKAAAADTAEATDVPAADAGDAKTASADAVVGDVTASDAVAVEEVKSEPVAKEQFEQLVLALADCKVDVNGIDTGCPAARALKKVMRDKGAMKGLAVGIEPLALQLLGNASPALRVQGSGFLTSKFGVSAAGQAGLLTAYATEKEPAVKIAMLQALSKDGAENKKVGALLIRALDDKSLDVRGEAIRALSATWNRKLEGGPERLMKAAKSDADMSVRRAVCEAAGRLGDEKLVPMYEALTAPEVDAELQASCMKGLIKMWADPSFENNSQKAFKLTLTLLERTPRNADMPSWPAIVSMNTIGIVTREPAPPSADPNLKKKEAWKNRVKRWYDPGALRRALAQVVLDPNAAELAAAGAVETISALGGDRDEIQALERKLAGTERVMPKGVVARAFDKVLGRREPGGAHGGKNELPRKDKAHDLRKPLVQRVPVKLEGKQIKIGPPQPK